VAVLLGAFFAGEHLTSRTAIAAAVIIGSVALVISAPRDRSKIIASRAAVVAQTK
jgi:drug/metabolite transporter (DMT)-like permease